MLEREFCGPLGRTTERGAGGIGRIGGVTSADLPGEGVPVESVPAEGEADRPHVTARGVVADLERVDAATYRAIAGSPTPTLDAALRGITRTADKSVLWFGTAAVIAVVGGSTGRRASLTGVAAIGAASALVNLGFKPLARRSRPDRDGAEVVDGRLVPMPESTSFPSGHSASAFAFAEAVSSVIPALGVPLRLAAATVAYSRVHVGVHYPGDVIVGSLIGMTTGQTAARLGARIGTR